MNLSRRRRVYLTLAILCPFLFIASIFVMGAFSEPSGYIDASSRVAQVANWFYRYLGYVGALCSCFVLDWHADVYAEYQGRRLVWTLRLFLAFLLLALNVLIMPGVLIFITSLWN